MNLQEASLRTLKALGSVILSCLVLIWLTALCIAMFRYLSFFIGLVELLPPLWVTLCIGVVSGIISGLLVLLGHGLWIETRSKVLAWPRYRKVAVGVGLLLYLTVVTVAGLVAR